jgi:DNA invertase Pin-like site-specific DNA recombinase
MANIATAYVRVSSKAADHATQRHAIERAAMARGDKVARWYSEKRSAKTIARPELDKLRADARAGRIRKLYVYRLDRLSRSGIRDTFEVIEALRACGVELITIADGFSLDGPAAEVIIAVLSWAAKMERLATCERISAARDRIEAEGGTWGRPRRLDDAQLAKLLRLRRKGRSLRQIAATTRMPLSTIGDSLRRASE